MDLFFLAVRMACRLASPQKLYLDFSVACSANNEEKVAPHRFGFKVMVPGRGFFLS